MPSISACVVERLESRALLSAVLANAGAASMAYDAAGALHVAWYDSAEGDLKYASREAGGAWTAVTTVDAGPSAGSELSLAVTPAGQTGIAYYDASKGDLRFASLDVGGTPWSIVTIDSKGDVGQNPSLAFDAAGKPLISYYAATTQDLRLAIFARNHWHIQTLEAAGKVGRFSSVAINPVDGSWAVAYENQTRRQIKLARGRGGVRTSGAVIQTLPASADWASKPSLAFSASGVIAISYADPADGTLVLSEAAGKRWSNATAANSASVDQTLSFDANTGEPEIVFSDGAGNIELASHGSTGWSATPIGTGASGASAIDVTTHSLTVIDGASALQLAPTLLPPDGLTAAAPDRTGVALAWNPAAGADGYLIERSVNGGAFAILAALSGNLSGYSDLTANAGDSLTYRLFATSGAARSLTAAETSVLVPANTMLAPTDFVVQISVDYYGFDLSWTDNATGETGYRVERSADGVHFTTIDILPAASSSYTDTIIADEQTYSYRVIPFDALGDGAASDVMSISTQPAAPTDLTAIAASASEVDLAWTNVSASADHLEIYCQINFNTVAVDLNVPASATSYAVTSLADGTPIAAGNEYKFWVSAVSGTSSSPSNPATATTAFVPPAPLEISAITDHSISLDWGDVLGETGYVLQWSPDNSHFSTLATLGPDITSYQATGLAENASYWFRIGAIGAGGSSGYLWYAPGQTAPRAPTGVVATALPGAQIQLDWTSTSQAATGYLITIWDGNSPSFTQVSVSAGTTSYTLTQSALGPLVAGHPYRISVATVAGQNQSAPTNTSTPVFAIA